MEAGINFEVNGREVSVDVSAEVALLYVLRNDLGLRGTRHGCGEGECGACTVLVDGRPVTACNTPVSAAAGEKIEAGTARTNSVIRAVLGIASPPAPPLRPTLTDTDTSDWFPEGAGAAGPAP